MARRCCVSAVTCRGRCGRFSRKEQATTNAKAECGGFFAALRMTGFLTFATSVNLRLQRWMAYREIRQDHQREPGLRVLRTRVNENEENDDALEA
jgi:hypothetical protein